MLDLYHLPFLTLASCYQYNVQTHGGNFVVTSNCTAESGCLALTKTYKIKMRYKSTLEWPQCSGSIYSFDGNSFVYQSAGKDALTGKNGVYPVRILGVSQ